MRVPLVDLKPQYEDCRAEIDAVIRSFLENQNWIMGEAVKDFETDLAKYVGGGIALGCASGTDALQLALMAMGLKPGEEVITTPFTFAATAETIALLGGVPVYADIEPDTYNIDVSRIEDLITPRTRAIIPVHLYGQVADMHEILDIAQRHGLMVIEDAAQALGAEYQGRPACSLGQIACTSFFPAKNLGAFGDAGAVFTRDPDLGRTLYKLRLHGSEKRYYHELLGVNSRIDALQAAILKTKLPMLDNWNRMRADVAQHYGKVLQLEGIRTPARRPDRSHIYQQYTIAVSDRDVLQKSLREQGIPSAVHYPIPLFRQPAFRSPEYDQKCPNAIAAAEQVLSLPMYPHLRADQVSLIVDAVRSHYEGD